MKLKAKEKVCQNCSNSIDTVNAYGVEKICMMSYFKNRELGINISSRINDNSFLVPEHCPYVLELVVTDE